MKRNVTLLDHLRDATAREQTAAGEGSSMGISAHLSAEWLSSYLLGVIAPGAAVAVEAHMRLCEHCRGKAGLTEHRGPSPGSVALPDETQGYVGALDDIPAAGVGFAALGRVTTGPWRRVARGVQRSQLGGVSGLGESVHLLTAEPGAPLNLPPAAHLLVVLRGAIRVGASVHSRGDFIEMTGIRLKEASACGTSDCLCLVVGDDDLYGRPSVDLPKRSRPSAKPRR
jgi:anti-sigma factor ChrR (cupin superfamily)